MEIEIKNVITKKQEIPEKDIIPIIEEMKELIDGEDFTFKIDGLIKVRYTVSCVQGGTIRVVVTRTDIINDIIKDMKMLGAIIVDNHSMGDYILSLKLENCESFVKRNEKIVDRIKGLSDLYNLSENEISWRLWDRSYREARRDDFVR